jgi:Lipocalin-like domain
VDVHTRKMEQEAPGGEIAMNRSIKGVAKVVLVITALVVWTVSGASDASAQQMMGALGQQIQGSWVLISDVNEQDGKKMDVYASNPRGSMILTPDGRFSIIIMRASLPKLASNNRMKGTAEENQAIVQGSLAFFGTYKVASEKEKIVMLTIEGSTFPNYDGQVQKRIMIVTGNELMYINPTTTVGGGTSYVTWKRAN